MKRIFITILSIGVVAWMGSPSWAKGHNDKSDGKSPSEAHEKHDASTNTRSNAGGKVRGRERAIEVQQMNTQADQNRGFVIPPGLKKENGKSAGSPGKAQEDHKGQKPKE